MTVMGMERVIKGSVTVMGTISELTVPTTLLQLTLA